MQGFRVCAQFGPTQWLGMGAGRPPVRLDIDIDTGNAVETTGREAAPLKGRQGSSTGVEGAGTARPRDINIFSFKHFALNLAACSRFLMQWMSS